ncbi:MULTISPECIES: acetyl-CoA C-acyltransferase family protein [Nitrosomonas]|uniref:Acetyl-CoA C-acetyltransferase n=1 Tax=Nitrosomonas communis TaxID=44574 RepID=A0A0F7KGB8_9PROT|nr:MULTISPECIES: acetyl-CoA C-acyltransferase family protein [Nitrosomonas]AKH37834.1 acetyl-CoA acetyltransferase [Nitrosomonas communis]TYP92891.1 acetyl-CoA C-acetyltransferase [Nitrosomonas communis]UVS63186.1 acetyl-CoA C-acyltransferase family protein [Nitrosomonas sp. PLL12]
MPAHEVVILSGVRTAIGDYGGALKSVAPVTLAAKVVGEAVARARANPAEVGHLVFGQVIHTEARDMYLARVAALQGGLPQSTAALTLNRVCGSGLQAILSAAHLILSGDTEAAVAGGVESMSRAGYLLPALRWGQRMKDSQAVDMMIGALTDPFDQVHMGVTAENIAKKWGISREEQDQVAMESHRRAIAAIKQGYFKTQILPIEIPSREGMTLFDTDEHPREQVNLEKLAELPSVFEENGTVTAGNASGINDGAAAMVLMHARTAEQKNLHPLARLVAHGYAGVDPSYMGVGPVPAVKQALKRAGLKLADMDVIESNEAFAVQACAVARELGFDSAKTNPNGGAVAFGHPIGATGCILSIKAIYELHRTGGRYALVTLCIGGGQGIAAIFERL